MIHESKGTRYGDGLGALGAILTIACLLGCSAGNRSAPATGSPGAPDRNPRPEPQVERSTPPAPPAAKPAETARVVLRSEFETAAVGSTVELFVELEGGAGVGSAPFHLRFDPDVLDFQGGREGPFLKRDGHTTTFLVSGGRESEGRVIVGHSILGAGDGVSGNGRLCVLTFLAVGPGDAGLAFERAYLIDGYGAELPATFEAVPLRIR